MVGRPGKFQPRFTAGELDPLMGANTDEAAYLAGAASMINARPVPQGGFANRSGWATRDTIRNTLSQVALATGATITAPVGGTTTNVLAGGGALMTTGAITTAGQIVFEADFPAPLALSAIDLNQFGASVAGQPLPATTSPSIVTGISGTLSLLARVAGVWTQIGPIVAISDTLRTRRFTPGGPGTLVNATGLRVVVNTLAPTGALFSMNFINAWAETTTPSNARVRAFTHSVALTYDFVFTDQNIEVYGESGRVASLVSPFTSALVPTMDETQQIDTMVAFHQSVQPPRFMRQGADTEWNTDLAPFENIPSYDYGAAYTNGQPAIWQIQFFNFDTALTGGSPLPSGGASFTIAVNGVASPAIQQPAANYSGTAAALQAAINALPGVSPGVTVVNLGGGTTNVSPLFQITFSGAGNEGDGWAVSGTVINKADAAITAAHYQQGVLGGEPLMSATRGWPATGEFFAGRLVIGGFAGAPNAFLASEAENYWQLDTRLTAASAPMLVPVDTKGAATIRRLHKGRTLLIFCDGGEYWLSGSSLDRTVTPVIVLATTNGTSPNVLPLESQGRTLFAPPHGNALFGFVFDYAQQNYTSPSLSTKSAALVNGIIDAAHRPMSGASPVNDWFGVGADGGGVDVTLLQEEEIQSFSRIATDGALLAVNVNGAFEVSFITRRQVNGASKLFLERQIDGSLLDAAETHAVASDGVTLSGLTNFVGATVWVIDAGGFAQGPFAIGSGAGLVLPFATTPGAACTVGRWTAPVVKTLPLARDVAPRTVVRRPTRVHTVRLAVVNTTSVAISANGGPVYDMPIPKWSSPTDVPVQPYTGELVMEGLPGFSPDAQITITQLRPGTMNVIGVTIEADL